MTITVTCRKYIFLQSCAIDYGIIHSVVALGYNNLIALLSVSYCLNKSKSNYDMINDLLSSQCYDICDIYTGYIYIIKPRKHCHNCPFFSSQLTKSNALFKMAPEYKSRKDLLRDKYRCTYCSHTIKPIFTRPINHVLDYRTYNTRQMTSTW